MPSNKNIGETLDFDSRSPRCAREKIMLLIYAAKIPRDTFLTVCLKVILVTLFQFSSTGQTVSSSSVSQYSSGL